MLSYVTVFVHFLPDGVNFEGFLQVVLVQSFPPFTLNVTVGFLGVHVAVNVTVPLVVLKFLNIVAVVADPVQAEPPASAVLARPALVLDVHPLKSYPVFDGLFIVTSWSYVPLVG